MSVSHYALFESTRKDQYVFIQHAMLSMSPYYCSWMYLVLSFWLEILWVPTCTSAMLVGGGTRLELQEFVDPTVKRLLSKN